MKAMRLETDVLDSSERERDPVSLYEGAESNFNAKFTNDEH